MDEVARRKGQRYDMVLCDLEAHQVLEVSAGRKQEDVVGLLEGLTDCERVEAESRGYERDLSRGSPVVPATGAHRGRSLSRDPACGHSCGQGHQPLGQE